MMESIYYDGSKILSMKDINGKKPTTVIVTGNRSSGKTVFFNKFLLNKFIKKNEQFMLLYRYKYEIETAHENFMGAVKELFFSNYTMFGKPKIKGGYMELYLQDELTEKSELCGFAVSLNKADVIKKNSHVFNKVQRALFDEFQSETNSYLPNEVTKYLSIMRSISRGDGKQYRPVPCYLISNSISLLNPYFSELGISTRIKENTKLLKGKGFVLEQNINEFAKKAIQESSLYEAFCENNDYLEKTAENIYLNDTDTFIEKPIGNSTYLCTLVGKIKYGLYYYSDMDIIYCSTKYDDDFKIKLSMDIKYHGPDAFLGTYTSPILFQLRQYFEIGKFRFKDLACKNAIIMLLSY